MPTISVTQTPDGIPALEVKDDTGLNGFNVVDDGAGIVEAYVSVTGIPDKVNDVIEPGAYEKTLASRKPKGLLDHDWKKPVSKVLEIKEVMPGDPTLPETLADGNTWPAEAGALYVKAQYNLATTTGKDAYEQAKFYGDDQEWSIGYRVPPGGATKDATGIRRIKSLECYEFSQVLWGAMPSARSIGVKVDVDPDEEDDDDEDVADETDPDADEGASKVPPQFAANRFKKRTKELADTEVMLKGLTMVLRDAGYTDEQLTDLIGVKIAVLDEVVEQKSLAEVLDDVHGAFTDEEGLKNLVADFDYAIKTDMGNEAISEVENKIVDVLRAELEAKDDDTTVSDAVHYVATALADQIDAPEAKRVFTSERREELAGKGHAMADGSFPIENGKDLHNAVALHHHAKNPAEAKAHICKRAKELGMEDALPDDWKTKQEDMVTVELKEFDLAELTAGLFDMP